MSGYLLAPAPRQIGIFDSFIARQTEVLAIREKVLSLTGDSFQVKLANGQPLLQVEGQYWSLSGRKKVSDMAGNHLFDIIKEHFHIHTTFALEDPQGEKFMEIRNARQWFGSTATATFQSKSGYQESLKMKGDWVDYSAEVTDEATGNLVARIDRKFTASDAFFDQQTYAVIIAPGVDMALMAAMCICLDEKAHESG